jgi:sugar/nucleoside kinase (ribokinase family)
MSTPRRGLLAAGNWIVDYTKIIDVYPAQDALANILGEYRGNGGSPYNLLIDLARLRAPFPLEAIGILGDDEAGRWIRQDCASHGIAAAQLHATADAPTSYTNVMSVRSTGRRTFFHQRGANALLGPEHFDFSQSSARIFHLGYLLLLDRLDQPHPADGTVAAHVLRRASEAGFKTSIDVVSEDSDRFAAIVQPALRHADYAIMNEFEAERTAGLSIRSERGLDEANLRAAVRKLFEAGVREWVVIHFPEGALAGHRDGRWQQLGSIRLPQDRIAGATGAGDAFCAGLLYGLHQDEAMEQCLHYAVCSAAACMLDATCSGGLLPLDECLKLGGQFGFRNPLEAYV